MAEIILLSSSDLGVLEATPAGLFDNQILGARAEEFLADPRHHIVVAMDESRVIGFATAIHYVHPDKDPELWINEVGVLDDVRRKGIGKRLVRRLLGLGSELGCREAWVLTERDNDPAIRLYESVGGIKAKDETVMFSFKMGAGTPT